MADLNPPSVILGTTPITDPSLNDALLLLEKKIKLELNCHHIGTIETFNPIDQTASISINYTKTYFKFNSQTNQNDPYQVNYTLIGQAPVIVLGGGNSSLTFPISSGDECLVLFNDRDLALWFQGAPVGPVATGRLHSFSDAIALVGLRSMLNILKNYSTDRAVLQNDTTGIGVGSGDVKIYNDVNGSLGPSFTAFFTALSTFMTACAGSATDPVLAAAASAFTAAMAVPVAPTLTGPIVNIEGVLS